MIFVQKTRKRKLRLEKKAARLKEGGGQRQLPIAQ
jgi:hypothetical protein